MSFETIKALNWLNLKTLSERFESGYETLIAIVYHFKFSFQSWCCKISQPRRANEAVRYIIAHLYYYSLDKMKNIHVKITWDIENNTCMMCENMESISSVEVNRISHEWDILFNTRNKFYISNYPCILFCLFHKH